MSHEEFSNIYLPFSSKMYALAYNILRNSDEARDCVQDVYAELWQRRNSIDRDKSPLPLVLTMVRNNCFDKLKGKHTENNDLADILLDNKTEDSINASSTLTEVMKMISMLPKDQQKVLRLRTIDGLEIQQIEEITHFSRENIYTLLSRARKTLRDNFKSL
ncbi:MAG: RNA polymerase sigma factor [Bacteroidales bacterium]|nr:RNA polymerase sigma factor [Bacteroidales bacterium]MBQ2352081.1 RNA polymerase sigma factor [Bacteroidales bacterium]MBQ2542179.1 RNA polymerase sigma factor [Bacteroidales bacterium]